MSGYMIELARKLRTSRCPGSRRRAPRLHAVGVPRPQGRARVLSRRQHPRLHPPDVLVPRRLRGVRRRPARCCSASRRRTSTPTRSGRRSGASTSRCSPTPVIDVRRRDGSHRASVWSARRHRALRRPQVVGATFVSADRLVRLAADMDTEARFRRPPRCVTTRRRPTRCRRSPASTPTTVVAPRAAMKVSSARRTRICVLNDGSSASGAGEGTADLHLPEAMDGSSTTARLGEHRLGRLPRDGAPRVRSDHRDATPVMRIPADDGQRRRRRSTTSSRARCSCSTCARRAGSPAPRSAATRRRAARAPCSSTASR